MATLVENYICQHFDNIYNEICYGTSGQAEWRRNRTCNWKVKASRKSVMKCIRQVLHLCLNAGKVAPKYEMIEEWSKDLLINACMPAENLVSDSYRYSKLVESSEQFTKYLFGCFDWNITDENTASHYYKGKYNRYIEQFDSRIGYYKKCVLNGGGYESTADLLYNLKTPRNEEAHSATEEFYTERPKCLQRLVYNLYDYITVFYVIDNICKDEDDDIIKLREVVCQKTQMPKNILSSHIVVKCIDKPSGLAVSGREADLRLYRLDKNGSVIEVDAVLGNPGKFEVSFFDEYVITIVTDGEESPPSEKFVVDQDFVDETIVKVNIPPSGTPHPEKISIRELVFNSEDLPANIAWILDSLKQYAGKCEYAEVARLLTLASVTKSEASKKAYADAIKQLEESLKQKIKTEEPANFKEFLQVEIQKFQNKLSEPYKGKEDFKEMCRCIDEFYNDNLKMMHVKDEDSLPEIEQIWRNVEQLLSGEEITVGTVSMEKAVKAEKMLARLEMILSMNDKYPEIIESEFGQEIPRRIAQLYVDQISFYWNDVTPLWTSTTELYNYIKAQTNEENEDKRRALEYAKLLDDFTNDTPEHVLMMIMSCREIFKYWLEKCCLKDAEIVRLKNECEKQINVLLDKNNKFKLPKIDTDHDNYKLLENLYANLKDSIEQLKNRKEQYRKDTEYAFLTQKKEHGVLAHLGIITPFEDKKDILSEIRFDSLCFLLSHNTPGSFRLFLCSDKFDWLFSCCQLGFDGYNNPYIDFIQWREENQKILRKCTSIIHEIYKKCVDFYINSEGVNQYEVNNLLASRIVEHQKKQIKQNYGENIPDYLHDIIEAPSVTTQHPIVHE